MKKTLNLKKYASIIFLLYGLSSCEEVTEYYFEDYTKSDKADFTQVYWSKTDFIRNNPIILDIPNQTAKTYTYWTYLGIYKYYEDDDYFDYYFYRYIYVEARNKDGRSNWSVQNYYDYYFTYYSRTYHSTVEAEPKGVKDQKGNEVDYINLYIPNVASQLNSPPAHLHLVLDRWDENVKGEIASKSWVMQSVVDLQGKSLADDPDWTSYTDNVLEFQKATKFVYTPGEKRSETELDLFGTEKEHKTLTGTYSVKEDASKKVTLTLGFPKFTQVLEVVESSWTSLTLKGTVKGKTGIMKLTPAK